MPWLYMGQAVYITAGTEANAGGRLIMLCTVSSSPSYRESPHRRCHVVLVHYKYIIINQ